MTSNKNESRKPAHEPKKAKDGQQDETVELKVEELEERIAPMKTIV